MGSLVAFFSFFFFLWASLGFLTTESEDKKGLGRLSPFGGILFVWGFPLLPSSSTSSNHLPDFFWHLLLSVSCVERKEDVVHLILRLARPLGEPLSLFGSTSKTGMPSVTSPARETVHYCLDGMVKPSGRGAEDSRRGFLCSANRVDYHHRFRIGPSPWCPMTLIVPGQVRRSARRSGRLGGTSGSRLLNLNCLPST